MLDRIVEFSELLRRNGLRVSVPENMDAANALELVGVGDQATFKSALRAALVKRAGDAETFDELFDLFFLGLGGESRRMDEELMRQLGMTPAEFQAMLEEIEKFLESLDGGATWSPPIAPPKELKSVGGLTWLAYDPKNDGLYLMKMTSELFQLARSMK